MYCQITCLLHNYCVAQLLLCIIIYQVNQTLPDRIIVFRDGVGDGQMFTVVEFEVYLNLYPKCYSKFGKTIQNLC